MRTLKWGIVMLALGMSVASCSNKEGETSTTSDSTAMTTVDTMSSTTTTNTDTSNMQPANSEAANNANGGAGNNSETSNMNNGTGNVHGSATNGASAKIKKSDTAGFAQSGEYNSDKVTPKPRNLDDKQFIKHKPAHAYGDTAPRSRPGH